MMSHSGNSANTVAMMEIGSGAQMAPIQPRNIRTAATSGALMSQSNRFL